MKTAKHSWGWWRVEEGALKLGLFWDRCTRSNPYSRIIHREVQKRRYLGLLNRPAEMYGMVRVMAKLDNMMFNISIDGKRKRYFM